MDLSHILAPRSRALSGKVGHSPFCTRAKRMYLQIHSLFCKKLLFWLLSLKKHQTQNRIQLLTISWETQDKLLKIFKL